MLVKRRIMIYNRVYNIFGGASLSKKASQKNKMTPHSKSEPVNEAAMESVVSGGAEENIADNETASDIAVEDNNVKSEPAEAEDTGESVESAAENTDTTAALDEECGDAEAAGKDVFLNSLETLSADELAPPPAEKHSGRDNVRGIIRYIAMFVCAIVFLTSAWSLVRVMLDYKRGDDIYGGIANNIFDADIVVHAVSPSNKLPQSPVMLDYYTALSSDVTDTVIPGTTEHNIKFEQIKANLNYLKSVNPDVIGYIYIEDTKISFPIVQGEDNDYYLDRAWNGDYLVVGSIFADCYVDEKIDNNRNTVLYGHNMLDGNMFNNVMLFFDKEVFDNKVIEVYTFDGIYTFKPFSVFETLATYQYFRTHFTSDEDFLSFCEEMKTKSEVESDVTFTAEDRILTLSTCVETGHPLYGIGRYALHAKLVSIEK